jgi:protease secretion system outer membrane protein
MSVASAGWLALRALLTAVRRRVVWAVLVTLVTGAVGAEPLTLLEALRLARDHDPKFQSARHELEAGLQSKAIGRAGLLPKVSITASEASVTGERSLPTQFGRTITDDLDYTSRQRALQLRQPLYNAEAIGRFKLGNAQADYAQAKFGEAELDLVARLLDAYLNLALARDIVELSDAQVKAYEEQARRAMANQVQGEGTLIEASKAQALAGLGRAEALDAADKLVTFRDALAGMIGQTPSLLPTLTAQWRLSSLEPVELDAWLDFARERNPSIQAQRLSVEAARSNVSIARAGFQPTVDAVASINHSESDTTSTLNQEIDQKVLGVQLNVPLYAGGGVLARARQATASLAREQALLDAQINDVLLDVRRNWLASASAQSRLGAFESSVDSALLMERGTQAGLAAGMAVTADSLDATRLLFVARRDLAKARYEYLSARIALQARAGVLTEQDIEQASNLFE